MGTERNIDGSNDDGYNKVVFIDTFLGSSVYNDQQYRLDDNEDNNTLSSLLLLSSSLLGLSFDLGGSVFSPSSATHMILDYTINKDVVAHNF